jgi:glycosyltransferase involved in cell wall biosynthesis
MKIIMACFEAVSMNHGGPLVQILQTKKELERLGVNVELFDPWKPFSKSDCDLVHIFSANVGTFHFARNLYAADIPFVVSPIFFTQHSSRTIRTAIAGNAFLNKFRSGIYSDYNFTRQICNWSKAVLPNTQEEAELVVRGLGVDEKKINVVPNGVEARFQAGNSSLFVKKYGVKNFILNVGHIGPIRKNVLGLIRALKSIDHPAVIIGKISKNHDGEECVREAAENKNIILIDGLQNNSKLLASAYAACDTFALPSLYETPGIAALEAGLAGAKIVITPHGGTKEYFKDMAEYVEPHSVDSIRNGILAALKKPKDDRLQQHIKSHYLWKHVAQKTLDVYKSVLNG